MLNPYPWQQKPWQFLLSEVRQDRLAHALLLHGIAGLGKRDFATAFSAYILCDHKNNVSACGECQSCRWFTVGSHPDFFRVPLEDKSKAIKVDQLRELKQHLEKTSQRGAYQVALIESADTMNRAAANALLKTLEEPPGKVVILLVADRLNTLPATIMSRCQYVGFCASPNDEAVMWLRDQLDDQKDPYLLLKVADYAPLRALAYVELGYFELRDQLLRHLLRVQRNEINPVAPAADFLKQELSLLLTILMSMISDVIRLQHGVKPEVLLHSDCLDQLQSLAQSHDIIKLHDYFQTCQRALAEVQSGIAINPQLLLESVFIDYYRCCDVR